MSYSMAAGETLVSGGGTGYGSTFFYFEGRPDIPAYTPGVWNNYVELTFHGITYTNHPNSGVNIPMWVNIRQHDFLNPGGFLRGSFSGILTDGSPANNTIKVKCEFSIDAGGF